MMKDKEMIPEPKQPVKHKQHQKTASHACPGAAGKGCRMDNMDMDMSKDTGTMHMQHSMHTGSMSHALSRHLPMTRDGSGTGWNPDDAPMYMYMLHSGKWMYMLHGNFFARYNRQDIGGRGTRGDERWDAPDMTMVMA